MPPSNPHRPGIAQGKMTPETPTKQPVRRKRCYRRMVPNKQRAEELRRFRAEAAELLGIKDEKLNHKDTKDTKVKP
jgi:hypothetical protein